MQPPTSFAEADLESMLCYIIQSTVRIAPCLLFLCNSTLAPGASENKTTLDIDIMALDLGLYILPVLPLCSGQVHAVRSYTEGIHGCVPMKESRTVKNEDQVTRRTDYPTCVDFNYPAYSQE